MRTQRQKQVNIVTLGCSKNLVDSERVAAQLDYAKYNVVHNSTTGIFDSVIINTCGFIEAAKEESIQQIIAWTKAKETKQVKKVYVTGCLSQRYQQELSAAIPEVDAWFGTQDMMALLLRMNTTYKESLLGERLLSTPKHYAYVKISEGCNRTCSFCAIPLMRGKHVSKSINQLTAEVRGLAKKGVREIMLIAQELTYYGLDIYKKRSLHILLEELVKIKNIQWIRLHYAYPHKFPIEIIDTMKQYDAVCNYLDIPLQHASNRMLASMRRQITVEEMHKLLDTIQQKIPGITLRTTMIVGYPGETAEDFQQLLDFVEKRQFDRLGVFEYSHEESTHAYGMQDSVSPEEKQYRYDTLMELQQAISLAKNERTIGRTIRVMIDRKEDGIYVGRTEQDSPEVDNEVMITQAPPLALGDMIYARIMQAYEYDREGVFESQLN